MLFAIYVDYIFVYVFISAFKYINGLDLYLKNICFKSKNPYTKIKLIQ